MEEEEEVMEVMLEIKEEGEEGEDSESELRLGLEYEHFPYVCIPLVNIETADPNYI